MQSAWCVDDSWQSPTPIRELIVEVGYAYGENSIFQEGVPRQKFTKPLLVTPRRGDEVRQRVKTGADQKNDFLRMRPGCDEASDELKGLFIACEGVVDSLIKALHDECWQVGILSGARSLGNRSTGAIGAIIVRSTRRNKASRFSSQ
jgi:hypothetical protein